MKKADLKVGMEVFATSYRPQTNGNSDTTLLRVSGSKAIVASTEMFQTSRFQRGNEFSFEYQGQIYKSEYFSPVVPGTSGRGSGGKVAVLTFNQHSQKWSLNLASLPSLLGPFDEITTEKKRQEELAKVRSRQDEKHRKDVQKHRSSVYDRAEKLGLPVEYRSVYSDPAIKGENFERLLDQLEEIGFVFKKEENA